MITSLLTSALALYATDASFAFSSKENSNPKSRPAASHPQMNSDYKNFLNHKGYSPSIEFKPVESAPQKKPSQPFSKKTVKDFLNNKKPIPQSLIAYFERRGLDASLKKLSSKNTLKACAKRSDVKTSRPVLKNDCDDQILRFILTT